MDCVACGSASVTERPERTVRGLAVNANGHLFGDLALSMNGGPGNDASAMQAKLTSSLGVDISPDGTVSYQQKLNGKPVGGMPPKTIAGACVAGALLSGVNQNEVIAVGVRRDPSMSIAQ
jgi:hypothetical protein